MEPGHGSAAIDRRSAGRGRDHLRIATGILVVVATVLLWPVMVPAVGAGLVAGGLVARRRADDARTRALATAAVAVGATMVLVMTALALTSLGTRPSVVFTEVPTELTPPS